MILSVRNRIALAALGAMALAAAPAHADDQACIKAYEQTQILRKSSKPREARDEAAKCAESSCPGVLAKDCVKWISELDEAIPTVVFEAKSATGEALTNVKVSADGKKLVDKLDGKPVPLDPGPHAFKFEAEGGKTMDAEATLKDGEKAHKVAVTFPPAPVAAKGGGEAAPIPIGVWAFGGGAVVTLALGTVFAIVGSGQESDLDACKSAGCPADKVNDASTSYALADIFFTAGAVSAIAAGYLFLTRPTAPASAHTASAPIRPTARGLSFSF